VHGIVVYVHVSSPFYGCSFFSHQDQKYMFYMSISLAIFLNMTNDCVVNTIVIMCVVAVCVCVMVLIIIYHGGCVCIVLLIIAWSVRLCYRSVHC
jgi:hypothetical protein